MSNALIATGLSKRYAKLEALDNFNLIAEPGTITAVLGPNGSGKSTALRLLALLEVPDCGLIEIDGQQFTFPAKNHKPFLPPWPKVTLVFQELFLWPHLTVRQNIALPRLGKKSASDPGLDELIEIFSLREFVDRYPNEISGGQRQRAALARALGVNPKYLLLDEATSALDVEQVGALTLCLTQLQKQGVAIIMVTHLIGFARKFADQVIFLWEGKTLETGDRRILERPASQELRRFLSLV